MEGGESGTVVSLYPLPLYIIHILIILICLLYRYVCFTGGVRKLLVSGSVCGWEAWKAKDGGKIFKNKYHVRRHASRFPTCEKCCTIFVNKYYL